MLCLLHSALLRLDLLDLQALLLKYLAPDESVLSAAHDPGVYTTQQAAAACR
jgi:hypothetical protein